MCNQAVSLMAAELERQGICTVALQLLQEVARKVRPPRALWVPYPHGYPLGAPDRPDRQRAVIQAALGLLAEEATPPLLRAYDPDSDQVKEL